MNIRHDCLSRSALAFMLVVSLLATAQLACADEWTTVAEATDYRLTSSYDETVSYFTRLDQASDWVTMMPIGTSPQGRDLHLVIVSKDGVTTPEEARATGKVTVLIQNGIHSGEIDGKDACMELVRDLVITKTRAALLDDVILLIIPIFSVDAHENNSRYTRPNQIGPENAGFRATAERLNLNRDYLKLDAKEMRVWVGTWLRWMPDFFVDDHVTDGQDWQFTVSYTMAWHPNSAPGVREWTAKNFDSTFVKKLAAAGHKAFPYAFPIRGPMTAGLSTFVDIPRFSTGYTALWNRPGLLIEMHSLKDYETRVRGNYEALVALMEILNNTGQELKSAIAAEDAAVLAGLTEPYPLDFDRARDDSVMVDIHTYEVRRDSSAVTGGKHPVWDHSKPITFKAPYFGTFHPGKTVIPPRAYFLGPEWYDQINVLRQHGVRFDTLTAPFTADVELYRIDSVEFATSSFEGHVMVTYQAVRRDTVLTFPTGTAVIDMRQPAAKVVMQALEPDAPDSYLAWGMWNTCLERKEYIGDYMIDPLADTMLAVDAALKAAYEARLTSDSTFANDPRARRDFFYTRSRFHEAGDSWYPVARFMGNQMPPTAQWTGEQAR